MVRPTTYFFAHKTALCPTSRPGCCYLPFELCCRGFALTWQVCEKHYNEIKPGCCACAGAAATTAHCPRVRWPERPVMGPSSVLAAIGQR